MQSWRLRHHALLAQGARITRHQVAEVRYELGAMISGLSIR
jgi:hypothetical protein